MVEKYLGDGFEELPDENAIQLYKNRDFILPYKIEVKEDDLSDFGKSLLGIK